MGWTTRMVAAGAVTAAVVTSVALGGVGAEKPEARSWPGLHPGRVRGVRDRT